MNRKEVEALTEKASRAVFLQSSIDTLTTILNWYTGNSSRITVYYGGKSAEISNDSKDKMIETIKDSIQNYKNELDSMTLLGE